VRTPASPGGNGRVPRSPPALLPVVHRGRLAGVGQTTASGRRQPSDTSVSPGMVSGHHTRCVSTSARGEPRGCSPSGLIRPLPRVLPRSRGRRQPPPVRGARRPAGSCPGPARASSAVSASRLRTATPIRKRSSTQVRERPSAPASAAACGSAELGTTVEDRPDELVQGGEGQLGFGLDPAPAQHPHLCGLLDRVLEQRGLFDAGLAADHQRAAARGPGASIRPSTAAYSASRPKAPDDRNARSRTG
jgi:hypothetical protein